MSASGTAVFGGIGTGPQTPEPPVLTFCSSLAAAPLSPRYFAATCLYAGPTIALSTEWHAAQPSFCIIAWPDCSSRAPLAFALATTGVAATAAGAAAVGAATGAAGAVPVGAAVAGAALAAAATAVVAAAGGSLKLAPDWLAMYTSARSTSTSERSGLPPRGGIILPGSWNPLRACCTSVS